MDKNVTYSSSLEIINPETLFTDGYELSNQTVIQSQEYIGSFLPDENNIEFYIYDANKTIIYSDYFFQNYRINENYNPTKSLNKKTQQLQISTSQINLTPESDVATQGFTNGDLYAVYNFINLELGSSPNIPYYLAEISSDRTEIRLKSNFISTRTMKQTSVSLKQKISKADYFDEVYISFGNNEYHIGVNIKYDDSIEQSTTAQSANNVKSGNAIGQSSILIKLYDPLPIKYDLLDELYVVTKTAESQGYLVKFVNDYLNNFDNIVSIKGPNSNLKLNEFVNDDSINKNKNKLLGTKSSGSKDQLLNRLAQDGVQLSPNYSTGSFEEFVNFSSAKEQVSNFVEKISRIQAYEADIDTLSFTTSSNPGSVPISESIASLYTKIENEITAFSGFDYYQYYATSSDAYPKTGDVFPLQLLATSSATAQTWITGAESAGDDFDGNNQNWLYYTVPDFIKNNTSNNNYLDYVNMIGQSFDEVWLYTKAITEKLNTTNNLDKGIPLQLADDVITSLGYTGFGNNYNNQDNFIGLIGSDNGLFVPPTGSELINHYIAINGPGGIINYWEDGYSYEDYVESFKNLGFPYPIDKVSKEIFKRLYHNMAYLVKKKGTVAGLRQLINIWGIPNTILRINEFGGKNKDEENDYDLWYQRYSYAFSPVPAGTNYASASVRVPWQPLYRNYIHSHNKLVSTSTITAGGTTLTGAAAGQTSAAYGIDTQFTVTGGGSGGTLTLTSNGAGQITTATLTQGDSGGYTTDTVITITAAQVNALNDANLGTSVAGGAATFSVANGNLGAEQIVPDGIGFRFKTTGYPSSSFAGTFDSQSLLIKKSTNTATDADFGIALYYTGSTSGSHLGSTSSKYVDYGEMRFFIKGDANGGGTAMSDPIYLPFFDKGWWSVLLQRDQHPITTDNDQNTTYTLYAANKIYDGADGNQIGFQGSASIYVNINNGSPPSFGHPANVDSASVNSSWNSFSTDIATYGAGLYLGGWGNTLTAGTTGSIGTLSVGGTKGVQNAGKNFSGSLQEFRYYSHDISQSVFNDFVMNPESIEGNNITGSESSFDIVNFRAPLGNELENKFTSSQYLTQYDKQYPSVHPAITGSSPLVITASFYDVNQATINDADLTSSYDVTFNVNSSTRTYSDTNVETYFLDQPSIGLRNRVSNKIKYSTNLNFGTTLSPKVSIQQDPPVSQSYTDNINSLEVAFSPTEEVNDDIIQALGYGAIQEVIADPRFRSSSDDYYPGLRNISKDYFKKYQNRSQVDYLRLIKYFDDSLFRAIKNYVPARTSVSTGIVIKQHMLERNRYREPQVDIVTTQSYAPFNQPLTFKNLELTGSANTHQLWDPIKQTTYYSSSFVYDIEGGPGGSVNQYNILEEGGSLFVLESDDLALTATKQSIFEAVPLEEVNQDITLVDAGPVQAQGTVTIDFGDSVQTIAAGSSNDAHSIQIVTINPSDGSPITKKYCSSTGTTGAIGNTDFTLFNGTGAAADKATQFAAAVNSINGQGSLAATPTVRAIVDPSDSTQVILTQLYGGTDGNTTVTYGTNVANNFTNGLPLTFNNVQGGNTFSSGQQTNVTTNVTDLTVNVTFNPSGPPFAITGVTLNSSTVNSQSTVGDSFTIAVTAGVSSPGADVATVDTVVRTATSFTGGTSRFSNTFLNVDKSLRTPIYVEYDFETAPAPSVAVTIEASSSIRGVVYTNTTTYTDQLPVGSILLDTSGEKQYLTIHPEEDMYLLISSTPSITVDDYQIILGENILITTALAAQSTSDSATLLVDSFSNSEIPSVGSVVTGPDIKAGVVTTLGAVTSAGTGYTPGTSVLATRGAGGGNLTLTVTADANGNVTTASTAGANPGTGYSNGDVVTIVGGNNDATVVITAASPKTVTVLAFDPTDNEVTFNSNQTVTDNSKITFTETSIPDVDTEPVSQQGSWNYNVTTLGIDTTWDDTQEQFYDGAYSGSNFSAGQYYNNQYNPYRKVKPNSTSVSPKEITVNTGAATSLNTPGPVTLTGLAQSITFNTTAGSGVDQYYLLGITSLDIIPYQVYNVEYDVSITTNSGAGQKVGMFLQNFDPVTNTLLTPQIVSATTNFVAGTGYSMNGNVATTAGGSGTGLTVDILEVNSAGAIQEFVIDDPGDGNYAIGETVTITGGDGNSTFTVARNSTIHTNGVPESALTDETSKKIRFSFRFLPNLDGDTALSARYTLGFQVDGSIVGSVSNIVVTGEGGIYEDVKAPIFFSQQDAGYGGQRDYQNMELEDAQGNVIGGVPIKITLTDPISGTGYSSLGGINQSTLPVTGVGTGLTVNFTADGGGNIQTITIGTDTYAGPTPAKDYNVGDIIRITGGNQDALFTIAQTNSEIYLVENTQSVLYDNSEYNPLSNNVNTNRSSSHRYVLSYGTTQSVPDNFDLVVTQSYFPLSVSGTFPERADVPDSNYTAISSISPRYTGTKLKSLTYNFFTPSGSVGPEVELPIMPVNRDKNPVGFRVATEFLDGSVTSSFSQSLLGQGSTDWEGDSKQYSGSSTIDKHPIYMARFENSYEQLNFYNTYQFNIDQLIEIPREPIAGTEITPNSIIIDGSNENKKVVSSIFEPKRKVSIGYLNPKTLAVDYSTMTIGNFDILSGATEFLTVNTNANSRVSSSLNYQYTLGGNPYTSSAFQKNNTIQMVTGSNTRNNPENEGILTGTPTFTLEPQINRTGVGTFMLTNLPLTTIGGPGKGAECFVQFSTSGNLFGSTVTISNSKLIASDVTAVGGPVTGGNNGVSNSYDINNNFTVADGGVGGKLIITAAGGNVTKITLLAGGTGYTTSTIITITGAQVNALNDPQLGTGWSGTSTFTLTLSNLGLAGGRGYLAGSTLECSAKTITDLLRNAGISSTEKGVPITAVGPLTIKLTSANILASSGTITSNGFLLSGSLTTDDGNGDNVGVTGTNIDGSAYAALPNATYTNLETFSAGGGTGMTLNVTVAGGTVTAMAIVNGGSGYSAGDFIGVKEAVLIAAGLTTTSGTLTSRALTASDLTGGGTPYFVNFNPSPISSSQATGFAVQQTVPEEQQLLIGGPQLALYHSYNSVVSSSLFEVNNTVQVNPGSSADYIGPQSLLWTTSGSNPNNIENYMIFDPDGSDAKSYQETQTPFLIERGDIIRVEGVLNNITNDISQSTNVIEDFIVEEVEDFFYTSSFAASQQNQGALNGTIAPPGVAGSANVVDEGLCAQSDNTGTVNIAAGSNVITINSLGDLNRVAVGDEISSTVAVSFPAGTRVTNISSMNTSFTVDNNSTATATGVACKVLQVYTATIGSTAGVTCSNTAANASGATVTFVGTGASSPGWGTMTLSGGHSFKIGDLIDFNAVDGAWDAANWTGLGTTGAVQNTQLRLLAQQINLDFGSNNFTFGVDINATADNDPTGSIAGYNVYSEGEVGFTAPTFIRVTPDPITTLNGLSGGEITKFTIRRQIEADDKVMLKNVNPPSGSRGVKTSSGQGFLIPNDFSEVQKANALNIINQLRAKNAFDKPNEPGVTDGGNSIIVQGSGSDTIINIP